MNEERIKQCKADIAALQKELEQLQKPKRFYLGDVFETDFGGSWRLCKVIANDKDGVILINERGGSKYSVVFDIPIHYDGSRSYTEKLPTVSPQDFGLSKEYGV